MKPRLFNRQPVNRVLPLVQLACPLIIVLVPLIWTCAEGASIAATNNSSKENSVSIASHAIGGPSFAPNHHPTLDTQLATPSRRKRPYRSWAQAMLKVHNRVAGWASVVKEVVGAVVTTGVNAGVDIYGKF